MATANDMIQAAMEIAGIISPGETLGPTEAEMGRKRLNTMLESWKNKRVNVYQVLLLSYTLTASDENFTIGSGGDKDTTPPLKIVDPCYVREGSTDYPLQVIEAEEYGRIVNKTTVESNYPRLLYYDPAYPLGVVYVYPAPSAANTLYFSAWQALQSFSTLTASLSLPEGYQEAIEYSLAKRLAGIYTVPWSRENNDTMKEAVKGIQNLNSRPIVARSDLAAGWQYDINADV